MEHLDENRTSGSANIEAAAGSAENEDDNETYSQCTRYDIDWTAENISVVTTASFVPNSSWPVVPCDHGWEYEMSEVKSSIVIDVRSFSLFLLYSF
uniref:Uncharacterized protein n=1 Tax=Apis cerana TaxID=7461 RepID=V9IHU5_APICE